MREVLVVELLGGIGDTLLALPAVHALARSHPGAAMRVLTFEPGDELLSRDPLVTEVVGVPKGSSARSAVATQVRRQQPELAVSTTSYDGIDQLLTEAVPRAVTNLWRSPPADELVDQRFLRLLAADGLIAPEHAATPLALALVPAERAQGRQVLGQEAGARPVLLLPGAGMPVKRWPAARWTAVAEALRAAGRAVLTPAGEAVPGSRALPPLSLRALAAVTGAVGEQGGVAVGGDTGPLRLAAAAGCPTVGLFGPTLAVRYGRRPGQGVDLQGLPGCAVRRPTSITEQDCWWSARCPLVPDGDPACMADVGVGTVVAAVLGHGLKRAG